MQTNESVLHKVGAFLEKAEATLFAAGADAFTAKAQRRHPAKPIGGFTTDDLDARIWAVEGAGGVGYLLAQQLVAAGERVLDVPATLAARVRVLGSGRSNKTDANDGYSIAVAARHAPKLHQVASADLRSALFV